jgi:hypothetical protein
LLTVSQPTVRLASGKCQLLLAANPEYGRGDGYDNQDHDADRIDFGVIRAGLCLF